MRTMSLLTRGAAVGILLASLAACDAGVNQVGAQAAAPITLSAVSAFRPDEVAPWLTAVTSASNGLVTLDARVREVRLADVEARIIDDLESTRVDIGLIGTRAWTAQGVHAFDALVAPYLVDSYELQQVILESGILAGADAALEAKGFKLLGVLPGPLRFAFGRDRAFGELSDFAGARFGMTDGDIARSALTALGATPVAVAPGTGLNGTDPLDGLEIQVGSVPEGAAQVAGNVALWPRPISVVMTSERFGQLTDDQRSVLLDTIDASRADVLERQRGFEREVLGSACRLGVRVGAASAADREAMRVAVEPVYAELRKDASTATAIDAITALRRAPGEALTCPSAPAAPASGAALSTEIDGTWRACPTAADILAAGGDPFEAEDNAGCSTMIFDRGVYREDGPMAPTRMPGNYEIDGDHLTILRSNGELFTFTYSLYKDQLLLSRPAEPNATSPAPMLALPWNRDGG